MDMFDNVRFQGLIFMNHWNLLFCRLYFVSCCFNAILCFEWVSLKLRHPFIYILIQSIFLTLFVIEGAESMIGYFRSSAGKFDARQRLLRLQGLYILILREGSFVLRLLFYRDFGLLPFLLTKFWNLHC